MTKWTAPDIASIRGDNSRPLQKIFGSLTEYLKDTLSQTTEVSQTYVRNGETTALTIGTVVYLHAQQGDRATVKRAFNTSDATSAKTLGVVAENIPAHSDGLVTTLGYLEHVNTSAFTAGQTLYLGATAGTFTATKPYAPNHLVYVGVVVRANAGNGIIYVRCQNGYELDEIHDVLITSPTAGQTLSYDAVTSLWKNATFSDGGGLTNLNASNLASGTVPTNRMTGSYTGITGVGTLSAGSIPATLLTGTVASARLPSVNIGTTSVALSRASGALTLAGITLTSPTFTSPALGTPASGNLTNCSFPTLNQSTTGSAASLTTSRTIWGQSFNGTGNVSGAISGATTYVGTGQMEVQNNNIYISGSSGNYFQHGTNTGSGQACQWATIFGIHYLVRNTSTKADKENIQPLNGALTPQMIDDIDVSLWNRTIAPNIPEVGPMAEDMNDISPFLATHGMDVDDNGDICRTPPNGISPNGWMSLLTIALQDTRKRLQQLEKS